MSKLTSEQKIERDRQRINAWIKDSQSPARRVTGTMLSEEFGDMERAVLEREQPGMDWSEIAQYVNRVVCYNPAHVSRHRPPKGTRDFCSLS